MHKIWLPRGLCRSRVKKMGSCRPKSERGRKRWGRCGSREKKMGKDGAVAGTSVCLAQKVAPGCWAGESDYYHKDVDVDQDVIILMSSLIIITRGGGVLLIRIMIIQSSLWDCAVIHFERL